MPISPLDLSTRGAVPMSWSKRAGWLWTRNHREHIDVVIEMFKQGKLDGDEIPKVLGALDEFCGAIYRTRRNLFGPAHPDLSHIQTATALDEVLEELDERLESVRQRPVPIRAAAIAAWSIEALLSVEDYLDEGEEQEPSRTGQPTGHHPPD